MAKAKVLRGQLILKENSLTEVLGNRILSYDSTTGEITSRPAISGSGTFVSSTLPSAQIIVGNGSNVATAVAMTGDITITNGGVTVIGAGVIVNADVNAAAAIAYSKLNLLGSVVNADVNASAAIVYSKLNLTGGILNADINSAAAITRSKTASGTAYRILANNSSGVMSENAALTAARAVGTDANGQLTFSTTTLTRLGYSDTLTGNIQDQLDNEIATKTVTAIVKAPTIAENGYAIIWDNGLGQYTLSDPVVQGIPIGGSTRQFLGKNTGANYDSSWLTLAITDMPGITASEAELNIMDGVTSSTAEINYTDGVTSPLQAQLDNKLSSSLAQNALFLGNASNIAAQLSAGTNGQVLQIVGSTPQWQTIAGTGTVTSIDVSGGATGLTFSGGAITTSGTITMAGTLDANNGGTGFSAYTVGNILYADTTSTLAKLAVGTNGHVLTLSAGLPVWSAASATVADADYGDVTVSGSGAVFTVDANINKAWTGTHSFLDNSLTILDNADTTKKLAFQVSGVTTGTTRTLTVPDLSGTIALLGAAGNGAALTKVDDTNVTLSLGGNPSQALLTASSITVGWSGQLAVTRGGTGLSSTTQGDILYADAANSIVSLPKNASATRYLSNTGTSNNPAWSQINMTNGVTGILPIANGGTGSADGAWLLSGTSAISGVSTVTSNVANQHIFNGTWTASANSQYHANFAGSFTARATISDTLTAYRFSPTLVSGATGQTIFGVEIAPSYTNVNGVTSKLIALKVQGGADDANNYSFRVSNLSNSIGFEITGQNVVYIGGGDSSSTNISVTTNGLSGKPTLRFTNQTALSATDATAHGFSFLGTTSTTNPQYIINLLDGLTGSGYTRAAGGGTVTGIGLNYTINLTGGATGDAFGIRYNPTVTNLIGNHYAIATASGTHGFGTLAPTHQVHVKGTSANQNLFLVEDDGGTNAFEILEAAGVNKIGFFAAAPVAQQSVNTILVNNVTSGGTLSTIANYTDLTIYANDAAAIRNNFYRLTEKVLALETALRNYGHVIN